MFNERADALAGVLAGRDIGEVMNNRRDLLVDSFLDQCDRLRGKHLREGGVGARQLIDAIADKGIDLRLELFGTNKGLIALFDK